METTREVPQRLISHRWDSEWRDAIRINGALHERVTPPDGNKSTRVPPNGRKRGAG
ncbi:hypothetical protein D3C80_777710 [compost metagenome]